MKKLFIIITLLIFTSIGLFLYIKNSNSNKNTKSITSQTEDKKETGSEESNSFDSSKYSLTDPESLWVIVNKHRAISEDFVPELTVPDVKLRLNPNEEQMNINSLTAPAVKDLFLGASKDGITLVFGSGYRSGKLQSKFYADYVAKDGASQADTYSARPGHSEHQTGFSADIVSSNSKCNMQDCWSDTTEGKWLADNSFKYGFIIRYPKDKESITGYQYEPWHIRYVGVDLALQIHNSNKTLEEFFNLEPAPFYN